MNVRRRLPLAVASASVAALFASISSAEMTKAECAASNADGQALRNDGKLMAARKKLAACVDVTCPELVRDDCAQRLDELERAQPTIVFDVKNASGGDETGVSVSVDGQPLSDRLGGMALRIDPGEHEFTFTESGHPAVRHRFVLKEGEKDRRERIVFDASDADGSPGASPERAAHGIPGQKIAGFVAGGVGVAGVAIGSVFGLLTFSEVSQQKTDCGSLGGCPNHVQALSDHSTASTDGLISTIGFIAGGALLAGGIALFFTAPSTHAHQPGRGFWLSPSVAGNGSSLSLHGEF